MDLDRYLATHQQRWRRLGDLVAGGRRGVRRMDASGVGELVDLHRRTSTDLSYVRTYYRDPALVAHLTRLVSQSSALVYGTRARSWRDIGGFFTATFPGAVHRARWFVAASAALLLVPALAMGIWLATSATAADVAAPAALREAYLHHDFEEYYASDRASQFSSTVFTNNIGVGITAFAGGIAFCVPTVLVLVTNGLNLGAAAGLFTHFGEGARFWGLVSPHGMLELTSITIAGAAGLQIGWAIIAPGDRTRAAALSEDGRNAMVIVLGLVVPFVVAGIIEGFVTGQPWSTALRVGIGIAAELGFVGYLVRFGRSAAAGPLDAA